MKIFCILLTALSRNTINVSSRGHFDRHRAGSAEATSMDKQYCVYIMSNKYNTVLYTGVTGDLKRRIYEHKEKIVEGFTTKYNIAKLVYYEIFEDIENAIWREKKIKGGFRAKKIDLIERTRKESRGLYEEL